MLFAFSLLRCHIKVLSICLICNVTLDITFTLLVDFVYHVSISEFDKIVSLIFLLPNVNICDCAAADLLLL